jgi:hypothetical protein
VRADGHLDEAASSKLDAEGEEDRGVRMSLTHTASGGRTATDMDQQPQDSADVWASLLAVIYFCLSNLITVQMRKLKLSPNGSP